ncbi:helix-turn-helix transcriptional regulator [Streptomyces venezuelae]|uniref:helix-turn-helix transcriptional regulator n=1 Tax=Streptomyces venezuelae TaxID=54571 RepID=UPI0037D2BA08
MDTSADPGCADRAPLAGRAAELARLDALLRGRGTGAGGAGGPVAVDVTGEPGIGKTRLLTEFATRARRAGATVLRGRATPPDPHPGPSFHPFTDAFADLDPGDRTRFPELAERAEEAGAGGGPWATDPGGEPEPHHDRATPEATRTFRRPGAHRDDDQIRRVAAALGRLAGAAPAPERDSVSCPAPAPGPDPEGAGPAPEREPEVAAAGQPRAAVAARGLVIVLDDFQGADPASVALVDHLLRHPLRAPVLLVLARRERQTPPALASVLARAADAGALTRLALGPLTPEECAEGLTPGLTRRQAGEVHALGLGNPLYHRALAHARTHREEAPGAGPVAVLLAELSPLRPLERSVVDSLAVLDGRATTALLAAVAHPADEAAFDAALGELSRRDLVRGGEDGRVLVLRHPALAELLRGTLAPWRRRELHRRAADALARAGASVTERAPHLVRAATAWDPVVGAELAEAAERIGAADPGRAADWLAAVLGLLPDTAEHRAAWRDLTLRRARALGSAGRVAESRDLLHHLIDACATDATHATDATDGTDGIDGTDETRTSAVLLCAFMERHLGRYPEADALLRRELERTPGPRPDLRTWLVVEWGCRALFAARYPEVRPVLADTLAEARRRGDDAGRAEVLTLAALGEAYEGETTAARVHAAEAAALTGTFTDGELADHAESLVRLSWTEVFLEQYGTAERHATRGIAMARRAGRPFALSQLLLCSAYVHFLTGRVGAALDLADESLAVARTLGGAELVGFSGAIRAVVLLHARPLGDPEALAAAEEAAAIVGTAEGWWATQARCLLGYCVPLGEDPHRVREVLVRAGGDRNLSRLQPSLRPGYLELLAGAALATGDLPEAERVARRALAEAEPLGLPAQRAAALRAWGQVLARRGEPAAAAKALTEAVRESARSGATVREAHSLLLAAPYVRAAGDGTTAAALWRRGRRLAADGGARLLADVADHTWPGTRSAPEGGVAGGRLAVLTPREREISVLVAEGLTNQAVAERLCLSPRTVESHVARVYRKTGVETRAGLASLVVRDGVVRDGGVGIGGGVGGGHFSRG